MNNMIVFFKDENGQGMLEYGLVLSLVALVIVAALGLFGSKVASYFNNADIHQALESGN